MTRLEQIVAVPKADGAVLYARRDDGKVFRYVDRFGERRGEWMEIPKVPGLGPLDSIEFPRPARDGGDDA